ncbi:TetR/AcrR family transcriptional regulator [Nocardioides sp.]|uniref:TetR/AcrR family transcriptional regulator n=1 Tax=Nocardioides sp. TaxID=35761 RepID=UPI0027323BD5|nr:TetR/AcrR family transcriptional regulator [Nocardioides sp.]MDP3889872.1 helix-turn-helix domain-containing protein [Nocardioides sp.]
MDGFSPLPMADEPRERRDAVRNRQTLLASARCLVEQGGVCAVTMDAVAAHAGVGKGTVFRRFESREGLMGALLNQSEEEWQAAVLRGPAPLGPGAPPLERLLAFGQSRIEANLRLADLISAAGGGRSYAAYSFTAIHVRHLLDELDVAGDIALLATALLAPLETVILQQQTEIEQMSTERILNGWTELVRRVIAVRR